VRVLRASADDGSTAEHTELIMTGWRVRDYTQDDLEALIRVDMESGTTEEPPLFPLSDA
jgi:hypothetical protein